MYDDDEYEKMRAYYEEIEVPAEPEPTPLTPKQLKMLRNHWEKDFRRAKKVLWALQKDEWQLQLKYTESVNFEI